MSGNEDIKSGSILTRPTKKRGSDEDVRRIDPLPDEQMLRQELLPATLEAYLARPSLTQRLFLWLPALLFLGLIAWAFFATIDVVVKAHGSLRPTTDVQYFISPFDGRIGEIFVREEELVAAGDTLMIFDYVEWSDQLVINTQQQDLIASEKTDLRAMLAVTPLNFDGDDYENLIPAPPALALPKYISRYNAFVRDVQLLIQQYEVYRKRANRADELLNKNVISIEEHETTLSTARLQELQITQYLNNTHRDLREIVFNLEQEVNNLQREAATLKENISKAHIISNVSGSVSVLDVEKAGVFRARGSELCRITPDADLHAEIHIPPHDIGLVREGLTVNLLLDAYSYSEWGIATGEISAISADVTQTERGAQPYFKVLATLDGTRLEYKRPSARELSVELRKGLTFQANIIVGEKRLIESLFDKTVDYFYFVN